MPGQAIGWLCYSRFHMKDRILKRFNDEIAALERELKVDLPKASAGTSQSQPEGVIVTLLPKGAIRVNQESVASGDYAGLVAKLKAAFARTESRLVILEGDRQAFLGSAVEVMDHARRAGADRFAIATAVEK